MFTKTDPAITVRLLARDGDRLKRGALALRLEGPTGSILTAERTALNFLQRLSGIATAARRYADAVKDTGVRVVDTRKTTPGWRALEKYAVRTGGCFNHRSSLGEQVLIKDNHIAAAGSLTKAVRLCRVAAPRGSKIEVEAKTPAEVREACRAGADIMAASDGTANPAAIAQLVSEGPAAVKDLLLDELQIAFDREATGELQMAREGGHHGCRTVRPSHASAMSR